MNKKKNKKMEKQRELDLLFAAARGGNLEAIITAEGKFDVNVRETDSSSTELEHCTLLIVAASTNRLAVVKLLLGNGADPLLTASDGTTALDVAEENGHAEVAAVLRTFEETGCWGLGCTNMKRKVREGMYANASGGSSSVEVLVDWANLPSPALRSIFIRVSTMAMHSVGAIPVFGW